MILMGILSGPKSRFRCLLVAGFLQYPLEKREMCVLNQSSQLLFIHIAGIPSVSERRFSSSGENNQTIRYVENLIIFCHKKENKKNTTDLK